jgi:hypothetical protein
LGTLAPFAVASEPVRAAPVAGARYHGAIRVAHAGKLALGLTLSADRRSFEPAGARDWQGSQLVASRSLPCVGRAEWAVDGRAGTHVAGARFRVRRTAGHGHDTLRLVGHFAGRGAIVRVFLGSDRHGRCAFRGRIVTHVTRRLRGSCTPRRTRTLALSSQGRVFDETDRDDLGGASRNAYGCAFRSRRRFFLSEDERPDEFVAAAATAGSLAATASYSCPLDCSAGIGLVDLVSGRTVRSGFVDQFCNQSQDEPPEVSALVLSPSGSYAYIARGFEAGSKPTVNDVVKNVAGRETALDCGTGIGPHSLSLRGSTLHWTNGGQERTAPLE